MGDLRIPPWIVLTLNSSKVFGLKSILRSFVSHEAFTCWLIGEIVGDAIIYTLIYNLSDQIVLMRQRTLC